MRPWLLNAQAGTISDGLFFLAGAGLIGKGIVCFGSAAVTLTIEADSHARSMKLTGSDGLPTINWGITKKLTTTKSKI